MLERRHLQPLAGLVKDYQELGREINERYVEVGTVFEKAPKGSSGERVIG